MSSHDAEPTTFKPIRLQRFLAQCGLGSRRDCEELITAGRIEVDGKTVTELGTTVDPSRQSVSMDGERLKVERKKYFMLNKPSGYLCTSEDPQGRRVVLDLFPQDGPRLFTIGRLDENTTGLILVTNDGDLAQRLAHPRYRIFRLYRAQVAGQPTREIFEQLQQGLYFTEGKFRVYSVKPVKKQKDSTWVEITMTEGQNREIRRLFARVGHKVMKLERIGYGPLRLGRLAQGEFRDLSRDELADLHAVLERNKQGEALAPSEEPRRSARSAGPHGAKRQTGSGPMGNRQGGNRSSASRPVGNRQADSRQTGSQQAEGRKTGSRPTGKRVERVEEGPASGSRPPSRRQSSRPDVGGSDRKSPGKAARKGARPAKGASAGPRTKSSAPRRPKGKR